MAADLLSEEESRSMTLNLDDGSRYKVKGTPPLKPRALLQETAAKRVKDDTWSQFQPENDRVLHTSKATDHVSSSSEENRRFHNAADSENSDNADIGNPLPKAILTRNTRFTTAGSKLSDPKKADNGPNQSFILPDLPNITELVSGIRQDGTPLFSRSSKSRSRFVTPADSRKPAHQPVASVPETTDEKVLYASLQLLRGKVAELEKHKEQSEKKLEESELEVLHLKSRLEEIEHAPHRDSGIGTEEDEAEKTRTSF